MRYSLDDTIAAISTPIGEGGIGIVRISGPEALSILRHIFRWVKGDEITSYRLHYGHVFDPETGEAIDEVLVSLMKAPHTYTREDVVEINCHGGIVPLRRILELCLREGARLASPGEFTLRAFLNGRIDLAQAEAVLDVVQAKTEASLRVAVDQLEGGLSEEVRQVRGKLVDVLAYLEASIDFPEDEIPACDVEHDLEEARERLEKLLSHAGQGIIYRQGIRTAIVGKPNVGKSSLLNALLRTSRAIVAPIPGTTRDTLEETLNLQGIPLVLVDTAGIVAETEDVLTRLSVERSRRALAQADLALLVVDGSEPLTEADRKIAALVGDKTAILAVNKLDLPQIVSLDGFLPHARQVSISALTGEGLEKLEETIVEIVFSGQVLASDELLVSNPRHEDALRRALGHINDALKSHARGTPADFVAIDLTSAINALGEITGETVTEDLLEAIFSNFCVGK
ncbi:MAG: tRNA uridine-5-carboxymethylaminomethyl(34) synthesis GTPase MnmE [Chloroflexota bacterium]|nr:tRNA uridine-5-carboxymethylaminomethyl(34) synthesis GTPase MnmE [Chloroflexota bacterium]